MTENAEVNKRISDAVEYCFEMLNTKNLCRVLTYALELVEEQGCLEESET